MKTLKTLAAIATTLGLVLPTLSYADYMAVKYNTTKPAACTIKYEYYDGDNKQVTCTYTDDKERPASNNWVNFPAAGCNVRHVDNANSHIYVSPTWKSPCSTVSAGSVRVGGLLAYKTYGKNQKSEAIAFLSSDKLPNGVEVKNYLEEDRSSSGCYQKMNVGLMAADGKKLRVKINIGGTYALCPGKKTYFLQ